MTSFILNSTPRKLTKTNPGPILRLRRFPVKWIEVREDWNTTRRRDEKEEWRRNKGSTKGYGSVNVFSIKASPADFSEPTRSFALSFLPFFLLSIYIYIYIFLSSLLFRLPNSSRSPHLIRLLAFSRMKELQRPHWDTRKYYLSAVTDQDDVSSFSLRIKGGETKKERERESNDGAKRETPRAGEKRRVHSKSRAGR